MGSCILDVDISPRAGPPGSPVNLTVQATDAGAVTMVLVGVVGYGFEETLSRRGLAWSADTVVPWEASPGEYVLDVYAVDANGHRVATTRGSFTVTG